MTRQTTARVDAALGTLGPLDREVLTLRPANDVPTTGNTVITRSPLA